MSLPAGGTPRPIVRWGTPVMHQPSRPVTAFDSELEALVADMVATMRAADGVGLAAPQVGVDLRVFVFACPDTSYAVHQGVVCNPVLTLPDGEDRSLEEDDEGCLSLPGAFAVCARPDHAAVTGVDHLGDPVSFSGSGMLARCLQHETDHLFGTVFADRISKRARKKLHTDAEKYAAEYPPSWPVDVWHKQQQAGEASIG